MESMVCPDKRVGILVMKSVETSIQVLIVHDAVDRVVPEISEADAKGEVEEDVEVADPLWGVAERAPNHTFQGEH